MNKLQQVSSYGHQMPLAGARARLSPCPCLEGRQGQGRGVPRPKEGHEVGKGV